MSAENVPPGVRPIRSGDVLHLTRAASPQFVKPITVRVIRLSDFRTPPPYGWEWIDAYELAPTGDAVARRELFVMVEGVDHLTAPPAVQKPIVRRPIRRTPVRAGA
ncbi:hypothetical protein [Micromonospora marina]|uniref:hypothetical protein n=1 Tax=Micromonospora marina TaxID=307120 RepID=UPI003452C595